MLWLIVWRNEEWSVHETEARALNHVLFGYLQGAIVCPCA